MNKIEELQTKIYELSSELGKLQQASDPVEVGEYTFKTTTGRVTLAELFQDKDELLMIHNMGTGCRYCTLWADGFNGLLPHLESTVAVAMVTPDAPDQQRRFASSRNWRFTMASHADSPYIKEQDVCQTEKGSGHPGAVAYFRKDGKVFRKNASTFGPGDLFCPQWHFLSMFGRQDEQWTPQFRYWKRPEKMLDGGKNLVD